MAYLAVVLQVLVLVEAGVPAEDVAAAGRAVCRWSLDTGRGTGVVALPVVQTGGRVAGSNEQPWTGPGSQAVDDADLAVVLASSGPGEPPVDAGPGAAEAAEVLATTHAPVAVLRRLRSTAPPPSREDAALDREAREAPGEPQRPEDHLETLLASRREDVLVAGYKNTDELATHVADVLSRTAARCSRGSESPDGGPGARAGSQAAPGLEGVWPYAESREVVRAGRRGRRRVRHKWSLVLRNTSPDPAYGVGFSLGVAPGDTSLRDYRKLDFPATIPPGREVRLPLPQERVPPVCFCAVTWYDSAGQHRRTDAHVYF